MKKMDSIVEAAQRMERDLKKFDMIFAILRGGLIKEDWGNDFSRLLMKKCETKRMLVLSDLDIISENCAGYEWRKLEIAEIHILKNLYRMYDFSDQFFIISEESQYGSLLNYVKTGFLTMEEVLQAFIL